MDVWKIKISFGHRGNHTIMLQNIDLNFLHLIVGSPAFQFSFLWFIRRLFIVFFWETACNRENARTVWFVFRPPCIPRYMNFIWRYCCSWLVGWKGERQKNCYLWSSLYSSSYCKVPIFLISLGLGSFAKCFHFCALESSYFYNLYTSSRRRISFNFIPLSTHLSQRVNFIASLLFGWALVVKYSW